MSDVVLGIETSCDETAAAVVERAQLVRSSVVSSQVERHAPFGGVVPEIAGRAHVAQMVPVIAAALISAGAEGADLDAFLEEPDLELPLVGLLVSGGHTMLVLMEDHCRYRLLGSTLDDAAGEAFDKVARYLGLGYPGGPAIDELAVEGDPSAFAYPRSMVQENPSTLPDDRRFAFSFSGLKTAVVNHVRNEPGAPTADVAASFQEAVVDALVTTARWAVEATGAKGMCLGGGVAANSRLRERFLDTCGDLGVRAFLPSRAMCTDNAAMVAAAGWWRLSLFGSSPLDTGADPNQGLPLVD